MQTRSAAATASLSPQMEFESDSASTIPLAQLNDIQVRVKKPKKVMNEAEIAADLIRGNVYFTAREDAMQRAANNPQLLAALQKQTYKVAKDRSDRPATTIDELYRSFGGMIPSNFFRDLQNQNPGLGAIVQYSISGKAGGGINIRMPKSKEYSDERKDDVKYARRILRSLRGVLQARKLNANRFNVRLLEDKKNLSTLRKVADPSAYIAQMRNYVRKYRSTVPAIVQQRATQKVTQGLDKVKASILDKIGQGLARNQNFPETSLANQAKFLAARKEVSDTERQLGLSTSSGAEVVDWSKFERVG